MFSIIVCSVDPQAAERLRENISRTIGVPFEFLAFDNRNTGRGICSVYNECARRAQYDLLAFLHEDVLFHTRNWGHLLAAKLNEADCGVVGFAGGAVKTRAVSGWCLDRHDARQSYWKSGPQGSTRIYSNPLSVDFSPVICLDGLGLFAHRRVWEASPFDDQLITGFHVYDLDFTTAAACRFRNYTCNVVDIEHFSTGSFSLDWARWMEVFHKKWHDRLPMFAEERPSEREILRLERKAEELNLRKLMRFGLLPPKEVLRRTASLIRHNPMSVRTLILPFRVLCKYVRRGIIDTKR